MNKNGRKVNAVERRYYQAHQKQLKDVLCDSAYQMAAFARNEDHQRHLANAVRGANWLMRCFLDLGYQPHTLNPSPTQWYPVTCECRLIYEIDPTRVREKDVQVAPVQFSPVWMDTATWINRQCEIDPRNEFRYMELMDRGITRLLTINRRICCPLHDIEDTCEHFMAVREHQLSVLGTVDIQGSDQTNLVETVG